MRRGLLILVLFTGCGADQVLEYDLEPIKLARAPLVPGGPATGGLLAAVSTAAGTQPLWIDSAYPLNSLSRTDCAGAPAPGWTYTGSMELRDGPSPSPLRASFRSVGLFDLCPGATGDAAIRPAGVMGGPLLANFAVGLTLPADPAEHASMTLWPSLPGSDDQLEQGGQVALHFTARGGASAGRTGGEASLRLPDSRIVLAACAAPRAFSGSEPQESCARGEAALRSSGRDVLLALGTGAGPLILSEAAWQRIAETLGVAPDAGTAGELYTPFVAGATPARYVDIPRLAILQGTTDSAWQGACTELARARRIEWVLANQDSGPCFSPCDATSGHSVTTRSYLELGGPLRAAVVSMSSELVRSLNADVPPRPQVDGILGAGTLAGTRLRLDYPSAPSARVVASCASDRPREACFAAPSCPALTDKGKEVRCFGMTGRKWAPVCP